MTECNWLWFVRATWLKSAKGSNLNAVVHFDKIKLLDGVADYIAEGCVPGGTNRNFESYGH